VVDDFTRECLAIEVDSSLTGLRVARVPERIGATRPMPRFITCDNGPEITGSDFDAWAHRRGVRFHFSQPGKDEASHRAWVNNPDHAKAMELGKRYFANYDIGVCEMKYRLSKP
jgi:transposase InsO family protein